MARNSEISHYLYPLNPKSGFVLKHGNKEVPTSWDGFFEIINDNVVDKWRVAKNASKLRVGDMIWVHFSLPVSALGAVGTVVREPEWESDWDSYAVWIRWDQKLTEKLRQAPIPRRKYRQVPYGAVLAANQQTSALLDRWLDGKRDKVAKRREHQVRFRMSEVEQRLGQHEFRSRLLSAYRNQCAISGCAVTEVLQAAHIQPVKSAGSHSVSNGLLLRADLHNLFDRGLITVSDKYIVNVNPEVCKDPTYRIFDGKRLRTLPRTKSQYPNKTLLKRHREIHRQSQG